MNELNEERSLQEIADKAEALYAAVKDQYEPEYKGKFLAIEVEEGNLYMGDTSKEAIDKARTVNPGKLFFLIKIGFSATDILASYFIRPS